MSEQVGRGRVLRVAVASWRDRGHPEGGGAEVFLDEVTRLLVQAGHRVTVCSARYAGAAARERIAGVEHVRTGGRLTVYPRVLRWLHRHRGEFDVVVDIQNGLPFWTPLLGRPVVNLTHHVHREQWPEVFGPLRARFGWWLEHRVAPWAYRHAQYFVVSSATRHDLVGLGVDADSITVGYNGLHDDGPVEVHAPTGTAAPALLVLGRLVPHKRVEFAIDAVAELRHRFPGLHLVVAGDGYWLPDLQRYVAERGLDDAVRFTGFVDEPTKRDLLAGAWLHLLPSLKEGWGMVVVEAAAQGTPTVAFRSAGGTNESVVDGVTGVLVDSPAEFVQAVARLLDDPIATRDLGTAARKYAATFTWDETARALEEVLHRAVDRAGRGPRPR